MKKYFLKIHTEYTISFPDPVTARYTITAVVLSGVDNDEVIRLCLPDCYSVAQADKIFKDEVELLSYMNDIFKETIIYGFNVTGYDIPYMLKRYEILNMDSPEISIVDMFVDYKSIEPGKPSYGLRPILKEITGIDIMRHKTDHEAYKILYEYLYRAKLREDKLNLLFNI